MKRFMITAAMASMLMTTATAYGKVENVMAAASSTTKTTEKKASKVRAIGLLYPNILDTLSNIFAGSSRRIKTSMLMH